MRNLGPKHQKDYNFHCLATKEINKCLLWTQENNYLHCESSEPSTVPGPNDICYIKEQTYLKNGLMRNME